MVYTPLLKDTQSASVFRVGSERAVYPNDYVIYDILPLRAKEDSWMTLNFFARELVEFGNRNPLPQDYQTVLNRGYRNTQIRALVSIENEDVWVGIGAGCRFSVPSNMEVIAKLAIPAVPRNTYPFPLWGTNPSGVIVQFAGPIPNLVATPFPMPDPGTGVPPLAAYTTNITAVATPCRPPVGDRLARVSQQVFTTYDAGPGNGFALIEIPSRARLVSIYDCGPATARGGGVVYSQFTGAFFVDVPTLNPAVTPDNTIIATLYPTAAVDQYTVPTNATHLLLTGWNFNAEVPLGAKLNVTWTLEL